MDAERRSISAEGDNHDEIHRRRIFDRKTREPRISREILDQPFGIPDLEDSLVHQSEGEERAAHERACRAALPDRAQHLPTQVDVEVIIADTPLRPAEVGERPFERTALASGDDAAFDLVVELLPVSVRGHAAEHRPLECALRLLLAEDHPHRHPPESARVVHDELDDVPVSVEEDSEPRREQNARPFEPAGDFHEPHPFRPVTRLHQNTRLFPTHSRRLSRLRCLLFIERMTNV